MRWFRWYEGTCEDGKFRLVASNAGVTVATVMGIWAALLEDAAHAEHRGKCVRGKHFYCAILDISDDDMDDILGYMDDAGLISTEDDGIYITQWKKRQFETDITDGTNAERQRRFREKHKTNDCVTDSNGSVTALKRPDTDTDTDTDKKDTRVPALVFESDWPKDFREAFWPLFPKRVDKQLAFKKLEQIRRAGGVPWETLVAGVKRYAESVRGTEPKYIK